MQKLLKMKGRETMKGTSCEECAYFEYDEEEEMLTLSPDGSMLAKGFMDLEDLEESLKISFDKEEYETLNGFLIDQLDRIPAEDEHCVIEYEGYCFTVLSVDNNAIQTVKIEKISKE